MRPIAEQAYELQSRVKEVVAALSKHLAHRDTASLERFEQRLQELRNEYSLLLSEVADDGGWLPGVKSAEYEPFLRCYVAISTLVSVVSQVISHRLGYSWGSHVFARNDFHLVAFDDLHLPLPDGAVPSLTADLSGDLLESFGDLTRLCIGSRSIFASAADVRDALMEIAQEVGCSMAMITSLANGLNIDVMSAADFANELGITEADALRKAAAREVIAVSSWSGEVQFPEFQLGRKSLLPEVELVCQEAAEQFRDWPLAIWMKQNLGRPLGFYGARLGERGLWKPDWLVPAAGQFLGINVGGLSSTVVSQKVYRIVNRNFGPFYFGRVRPGGGSASYLGGRFDLGSGAPRGTLYASTTGLGACHEVLDREPVVTLRQVLHRTLWELEPKNPVNVADLTAYSPALAACRNRNDTQELASRIAATFDGLTCTLRTTASEQAVVMFGRAGPNLPSSAGLGLWSASSVPLISSRQVWDYLAKRRIDSADLPIVLRRFPSEITIV